MNPCKCSDFRSKHPQADRLAGKIFGFLTVTLTHAYDPIKRRFWWLCDCSCGRTTWTVASELKTAHKISCGCRKGLQRHGHGRLGQRSPTYLSYNEMKQRILNPNKPEYVKYGGNFLADMGPRPALHTLDRKDNNGNYSCGNCPECLLQGWTSNCRWATKMEQQRNRGTNRTITAFNQTKTVAEWAEGFVKNAQIITRRIESGWAPEDAVTLPPSRQKYKTRKAA